MPGIYVQTQDTASYPSRSAVTTSTKAAILFMNIALQPDHQRGRLFNLKNAGRLPELPMRDYLKNEALRSTSCLFRPARMISSTN
jgi:hypothetical protein